MDGKVISFSICLNSGHQYDHSYWVDSETIAKGDESIKDYLLDKANGDKVWIELRDDD